MGEKLSFNHFNIAFFFLPLSNKSTAVFSVFVSCYDLCTEKHKISESACYLFIATYQRARG